jgi:hypothetical protein
MAHPVRDEVPIGQAAQRADAGIESESVNKLKKLEEMIHFFCDVLENNGFNGTHLRWDAPKRKTFVAVTEPVSAARVQAIKNAKTAGQLFYATDGRHVKFLQARTLEDQQS